MDPMRWWVAWLEAATRAATGAVGGAPSAATPGTPGAAPNPFFTPFGNPFAGTPPGAMPGAMPNPLDLWRRWLEALPLLALNPFAAHSTPGAGAAAADPFGVGAWWRAWLAASATPGQMPGAEPGSVPGDPWTALRQWYERASAAASGPLEEWLRSDGFAEAAGAFWESAATATAAMRRAAEAQLGALGIASRADVARVASLVVQVEAKVDGIAEALEDAQDAEDAHVARANEATARADTLAALERRVERMEARLDRLLAALEAPERREIAAPASPPGAPESAAPASGNGASASAARAHKPSTTRTRRKPPSGT